MVVAVRLRDVEESDLPVFFRHQLDPEALRMAGFTPRDEEAFMVHWKTKVLGDEAGIAKTVVVDGEVAGNLVVFDHAGKREVGYWIGREHWGRGVATAALSQLLELVKERPLYAGVVKHNAASIRVLEKCGFRVVDEPLNAEDDDDVEEVLLKLED